MILQAKNNFPAEWAPQDAILLCWPYKTMDWEPIQQQVEPVFCQIASVISNDQPVIIIAHDHFHQIAIEQQLQLSAANMNNIDWLIHTNNDTWCRDFGPITIRRDAEIIALDYQFNGWGNKFESSMDNLTTTQLKAEGILNCDIETIPIVLEGGSIDSDGIGSLLTTEQCLLSPERNPELNKQQIEDLLKQQLGCERIIWLKSGQLEGDDTDSHIDNLARFCNPNTIAYTCSNDPNDSHYQSLKQMEIELKALRTTDDQAYQLIALNIPTAIFDNGQRLPASYVNFLITNKQVLMPTFNDANDNINLAKLQSVFPDREVIGINSESLIKQSGSIHCLTMQLTKGSINNEKMT